MTSFKGVYEKRTHLICQDPSRHVLDAPLLSQGMLDETPLYPCKNMEQALTMHAYAVLLASNHPGDIAHPSRADFDMTRKVARAFCLRHPGDGSPKRLTGRLFLHGEEWHHPDGSYRKKRSTRRNRRPGNRFNGLTRLVGGETCSNRKGGGRS